MRYNRKSSKMPRVLLNFWIQTRFVTTCKTETFQQPIAFSMYDLRLGNDICSKLDPTREDCSYMYCNATFTRQDHMRRVHGRICREREVNLYLHLQHLSEEKNFKNEWQFVESRPIKHSEHNVCPCGQTHIESYFFIENKWKGNHTFVGSDCVTNVDPKAAAVIGYFKHILENTA